MRRAYVTNWIVLNTAGWASRTQPLESYEGGFNTQTGETRIGPGMWADLAPEADAETPPIGIPLTYDITRTDVDLAVGQLRVNSDTMGSVTRMFIHAQDSTGNDHATTLQRYAGGGTMITQQATGEVMTWLVTGVVNVTGLVHTLAATYMTGAEHAPNGVSIRVIHQPVLQTVVPINEVVDTYYLLLPADAGKLVRCTNADPIALEVPTNAVTPYPVGTRIRVEQGGDGQITVFADGAVTLNAFGGLLTAGKFAIVELVKTATNVWSLYGGTA